MAGRRGAGGRLAAFAQRQGIVAVFVVLVVALFATKPTFGTYQNIVNVLQQNSVIAVRKRVLRQ